MHVEPNYVWPLCVLGVPLSPAASGGLAEGSGQAVVPRVCPSHEAAPSRTTASPAWSHLFLVAARH